MSTNKILNIESINKKIIDYVHELEHTEMYIDVLKQVSYKAARLKIYRICQHYINQYFIPSKFSDELGLVNSTLFEDLILNNTNKDERKWIMKEMSDCDCCLENQQGKPTFSDYLNGHKGYNVSIEIEPSVLIQSCQCKVICNIICTVDNSSTPFWRWGDAYDGHTPISHIPQHMRIFYKLHGKKSKLSKKNHKK